MVRKLEGERLEAWCASVAERGIESVCEKWYNVRVQVVPGSSPQTEETPTQTRKFPMNRKPYPSDLTDAEWSILEPLIPPAKPGGHPRTTNMRAVVNAIFYLVHNGCAWRALPHGYSLTCRRPPQSLLVN